MPSQADTSIEQYDTTPASGEPVDGLTTMLTDTAEAEDPVTSEKASESDESEIEPDPDLTESAKRRRPINRARIFAYIVLPALALLLTIAAGYLKLQIGSGDSSELARIESTAAAKDTTIALLSYTPETAEKTLDAARDRLTGAFKDSYTQLTHDVVIPGAKQKQIKTVATVPAAASVQATPNHAVVLLYVNQTTVIGTDSPSDSVSVVRVTLDKVSGRWLVSEFDPI